jgi:hypothetical protein
LEVWYVLIEHVEPLLTFPDLFEDWFRTTGKRIVGDNEPLIVPARSMEEFLEGRENEEAYTEFYERFLPCATMKMSWDRRIVVATSARSIGKDQQSLCTSSDEAYALLLLENSYDRWLDIFARSPPGGTRQRRGESGRIFESDTPTLYTRGGIKYEKTKLPDEGKGWTGKGIRRYNELFQQVKQDRASNPDFERNWLEEKKRSQAEMEARPKKRKCDREIALSDIFGSDHEEDHGTPTTDEAPVDDESDDED